MFNKCFGQEIASFLDNDAIFDVSQPNYSKEPWAVVISIITQERVGIESHKEWWFNK